MTDPDSSASEALLPDKTDDGVDHMDEAIIPPRKKATYWRHMLVAIALASCMAIGVYVALFFLAQHSVEPLRHAQAKADLQERIEKLDSFLPKTARGHQRADYEVKAWKGKTYSPKPLPGLLPGEVLDQPVNNTLGFGALMAVNLPRRRDKYQEIQLLGATLGLKFDFVKAIYGKDVSRKNIAWSLPNLSPMEIGCYLSHVEAMRKIIERGVRSALVLEDDFDFDLNIRTTVRAMQHGVAQLLASVTNKAKTISSVDPWNSDDWDLIWVGHCGDYWYDSNDEKLYKDNQWPVVLYQDPTMDEILGDGHNRESIYYKNTGFEHLVPFANNKSVQPEAKFPRHRAMAISKWPACSAGYAVSQRGARKILFHLTRKITTAVDIVLAKLCADKLLRCLEPHPPIVSQWKIINGSNSDIHRNETLRLESNISVGHRNYARNSVRTHLGELLYRGPPGY